MGVPHFGGAADDRRSVAESWGGRAKELGINEIEPRRAITSVNGPRQSQESLLRSTRKLTGREGKEQGLWSRPVAGRGLCSSAPPAPEPFAPSRAAETKNTPDYRVASGRGPPLQTKTVRHNRPALSLHLLSPHSG